jgi:hypothetical protein
MSSSSYGQITQNENNFNPYDGAECCGSNGSEKQKRES